MLKAHFRYSLKTVKQDPQCPWLDHDYVTSVTQSISQRTHLENPILNEQGHFHCGELSVGDDLIKIKHSANGASEINNTHRNITFIAPER